MLSEDRKWSVWRRWLAWAGSAEKGGWTRSSVLPINASRVDRVQSRLGHRKLVYAGRHGEEKVRFLAFLYFPELSGDSSSAPTSSPLRRSRSGQSARPLRKTAFISSPPADLETRSTPAPSSSTECGLNLEKTKKKNAAKVDPPREAASIRVSGSSCGTGPESGAEPHQDPNPDSCSEIRKSLKHLQDQGKPLVWKVRQNSELDDKY